MTDKIPWPKTEDELLEKLRELFEPPEQDRLDVASMSMEEMQAWTKTEAAMTGYERSANALWKAAAMAFYYASNVVGGTGFQADWAAMQFLKEVKHIDGPFMLVRVANMLYPQCNVPRDVEEFLNSEDSIEWLREQAKAKLADLRSRLEPGQDESEAVAPTVYRHWRMLAGEE